MNVAVVGSRGFWDDAYMAVVLDDHRRMWNAFSITVISGGAKGADNAAQHYAKDNDLPSVIFLPDWEQFGKRAGYLRNAQIVQAADVVLAFWDGKSAGTKITIDLAVKAGKPVHIYPLVPC